MLVHDPLLIVPVEDQSRVVEAWRRRMLLESTWGPMLAEHGQRQLGPLRARLVGEWDTSANLFASVIDQTSTMYDTEPEQKSPDAMSLAVLRDSFQRGGWWAMARDHQRYVRGLHESLVYVGWDDIGHPTFELVTADRAIIETAPTNIARPVTIWRARERPIPGRPGPKVRCWDRWSIAGGVGSHTVWSADRHRDITTTFFDPAGWAGPMYPIRDEQGQPMLPFALYHSQGAGCGVWHPHQHSEVVFGTLQVGILWTAMVHGFLRASWDQRVLLNGRVRGGANEQVGGNSARFVTPDPTFILEVDSGAGGTASIASWGASIDIEKAEQTVRRYENRLAVHFGLSPADLVIESLNPASGASITVSQAGKRTIAARDLVNFKAGDAQLAEVTAAVNRAYGRPCSARGFRLRYRGIDLTFAERESATRFHGPELERNLIDRVAAYQEIHPGTTTEDAIADLQDQDMRRLREKVLAQLAATGGQPGVAAVQDTALNGAQLISLKDIVQAVAAGQLPRDAALAMVELGFRVDAAQAARLLGSAGVGFRIVPPGGGPAPVPLA